MVHQALGLSPPHLRILLDFARIFRIDIHNLLFILRHVSDRHRFFLRLAPLVQVLHDKERTPTANDEADVHRVALLPSWTLDDREHSDGVEREDGPASGQHSSHGYSTCLGIVAKRHVDEGHEDWGYGCGYSKEVVARDWVLLVGCRQVTRKGNLQ